MGAFAQYVNGLVTKLKPLEPRHHPHLNLKTVSSNLSHFTEIFAEPNYRANYSQKMQIQNIKDYSNS